MLRTMRDFIAQGVEVRLGEMANAIMVYNEVVTGVETDHGERLECRYLVLAQGREGADWLTRKAGPLNPSLKSSSVDVGVRVEAPGSQKVLPCCAEASDGKSPRLVTEAVKDSKRPWPTTGVSSSDNAIDRRRRPQHSIFSKSEKWRGNMSKLTEERKALLANQEAFIGTASPHDMPNIGPKGSTRILDDKHIVFYELTGGRKWENLQNNPKVAIAVVDRNKMRGY